MRLPEVWIVLDQWPCGSNDGRWYDGLPGLGRHMVRLFEKCQDPIRDGVGGCGRLDLGAWGTVAAGWCPGAGTDGWTAASPILVPPVLASSG